MSEEQNEMRNPCPADAPHPIANPQPGCSRDLEPQDDVHPLVPVTRSSEKNSAAKRKRVAAAEDPDVIVEVASSSENERSQEERTVPLDVQNLVVSAVHQLNNESGSTLAEIKSYIKDNNEVRYAGMDNDIKNHVHAAVSHGTLMKKNKFRYAIPVKKTAGKGKASGRSKTAKPAKEEVRKKTAGKGKAPGGSKSAKPAKEEVRKAKTKKGKVTKVTQAANPEKVKKDGSDERSPFEDIMYS